MKHLVEDIKKIYHDERLTFVLMILNLLFSICLIIFAFINLKPDNAIVKVGYGDIGGYRDGSWTDFFAFPILGLIFGILHNFIAVAIFHKRGAGMTKFFLLATLALIFASFIALIRILGEI